MIKLFPHFEFLEKKSRYTGWLVAPALAVLAIGLVVVGGLLNRLRGGWSGAQEPSEGYRWLLGAYNGMLVMLVCTFERWNMKKRVAFLVVVSLFLSLSYYADWDVYDGLGRPMSSRASVPTVGLFDWLIGTPHENWSFWQRFARDFAGLSLRGLMQTGAPGLLFYFFGYGWELFLSGLSMGALYAIGFSSPLGGPFSSGREFSELLWGMWTSAVLLFACLNYMRANAARMLDPYRRPGEYRFICSLACVLALLFTVSTVWFAIHRPRERVGFGQTAWGAAWCTLGLVAVLVLWLAHRMSLYSGLFPNATRAAGQTAASLGSAPSAPAGGAEPRRALFDSVDPGEVDTLFSTTTGERAYASIKANTSRRPASRSRSVHMVIPMDENDDQAHASLRDVCRMVPWVYGTHALRVWLVLNGLYACIMLALAVL